MPEDWAHIGTVLSVNPARRELRVGLGAVGGIDLGGLGWIRVELPGGERLRCKVVRVRDCAAGMLVELGAGTTRDSVALMKGAAVEARREDLAVSAGAGYDLFELEGMRLVDGEGVVVGVVLDVFETPAHGVLEVERPGGKRFLLPAIEEVILSVDLESGTVLVDDIVPYAVEDEG